MVGSCESCGSELLPGGRFCPGCAAPVTEASVEPGPTDDRTSGGVVVDRSPTIVVLAAVAVIGLVVAVLAMSRTDSAGDVADPPPPTTAAPAATSPPATTSAPTSTTTRATVLEAVSAAGTVDVSGVPAELAELTLLVFTHDGVASLDLDTGELVPFETDQTPRGSGQVMRATRLGIVEMSDRPTNSRFVDWSWSTAEPLPDNVWPGGLVADDDHIWLVQHGPRTSLYLITAGSAPELVREIEGWVNLVGHAAGGALISSMTTGEVHRVDPDGTISVALDSIALGGGNDWLVVPDCDPELRCSRELVDLRSGRTVLFSQPGGVDGVSVLTNTSGRRGLVSAFSPDGEPSSAIVDADAGSITPVHSSFDFIDVGRAVTDPDLRYVIEPTSRRIVLAELTTGDVVEIELPDIVTHVLVAPEGWSPPVPRPPEPPDFDLIVFVMPDASDEQVAAIESELLADPAIAEVTFVTQDEAYEQFLSMTTDPELRGSVTAELFPPSFEVTTVEGSDPEAIAEALRPVAGVFSIETARASADG